MKMTSRITVHRFRRAASWFLAGALTLTGLLAGASGAQAAPVSITFDHGQMSLGILRERVILPADSSFPSPDLPTPQRTDIQLLGDQTDGQVTIPATTNTGIQFPYFHIMHPIETDLKIPMTFRLNDPGLTGTWDAATGAMTLNGNLDIVVVTGTGDTFPLPDSLDDLGVPPLGLFARCRFNDVPVSFSTETKSPFTAEAFTGGFGVGGALTTAWDSLNPAVSENGGDCGDLNLITTSLGAVWLANGLVEPEPQPEPPPPTCETDLSLCPPPKFTEVDDIRLKPARKRVRAGRQVTMTVRVHNSGNIAARRVKVKIRINRKKVRAPKSITLNVPAGTWAKKRFKVRIRPRATRRTEIVAVTNGWPARAAIKILPKKQKQPTRRR